MGEVTLQMETVRGIVEGGGGQTPELLKRRFGCKSAVSKRGKSRSELLGGGVCAGFEERGNLSAGMKAICNEKKKGICHGRGWKMKNEPETKKKVFEKSYQTSFQPNKGSIIRRGAQEKQRKGSAVRDRGKFLRTGPSKL